MEALALPFLFTSLITTWVVIEVTLRNQRKREREAAKAEEESRLEASRPR